MRFPRPRTAMAAVLAGLAAAAFPAAAQPARIHVLGTIPDTTRWFPPFATRGAGGELYVSTPAAGVLVLTRNAPPVRIRYADGQPARHGALNWMGDTLAVDGWQSWRLFSAAGAELGCRPFQDANNEFAQQILGGTPLAGGETLGEFRPAYPGQGIAIPLVVSRDQKIIRAIAVAPPEPAMVNVPSPRSKGNSRQIQPLLDARPLWAAADDGSGVVWIEQTSPSSPGTIPVEVRWIEISGHVRQRAVIPVPALAMSEAYKDELSRGWARPGRLDLTTPEETAELARAFRKTVSFPDFHAPVAKVVAGTDGSAWLRLATESDSATWLQLDRDGREVRRAALPAGFLPMYADTAGLWGATREPDGVRVLLLGPEPVAYMWPRDLPARDPDPARHPLLERVFSPPRPHPGMTTDNQPRARN